METISNNKLTELTGLNSQELKAYYEQNPIKYYQQYVLASVSPLYNLYLACLGASEELCEFITAKDNKTFISECGDLLFTLNNVANFMNIDFETIYKKSNKIKTFSLVQSFGELIGTIMKKARYTDDSYFINKWGMSIEERVTLKLAEIISSLKDLLSIRKLDFKNIMDSNLEKLDRRHSSDNEYKFGSGLGLTRTDGGQFDR